MKVCALGHVKCKPSTEISPGDVILFLGSAHLITEIEPHTGPHDFAIGIARAGDGWGITLCDTGCTEVA